MHARYYDSRRGRFLSVDPAIDPRRNLQAPQRWNRYTYASDSPLKLFDPTGLKDTIYVINMLAADETIGRSLAATKQYVESHSKYTVEIVSKAQGTPGQLEATIKNSDKSDAVLAISHGGRDDLRQGVIASSFLVGAGTKPGEHPKHAMWGDQLKTKFAGSEGAGVVVFDGCQTAQFAQAYANATGGTAVGTTYGLDLTQQTNAGLAFITQYALTGGDVVAGENAADNEVTMKDCNSFGTDCGISTFETYTPQPPL